MYYYILACAYKLYPKWGNPGGVAAGTIPPEVEGVLHEAAHATTLSVAPEHVTHTIAQLKDPNANEIRSLAAELIILRELGAFQQQEEEIYLTNIENQQFRYGFQNLPQQVLQAAKQEQAKKDSSKIYLKLSEWANL